MGLFKRIKKALKLVALVVLPIALPVLGALAGAAWLGLGATAGGIIGGAIGGGLSSLATAKLRGQPWNFKKALPYMAGGALGGGLIGYNLPTTTAASAGFSPYMSLAPSAGTYTPMAASQSGLGLTAGGAIGLSPELANAAFENSLASSLPSAGFSGSAFTGLGLDPALAGTALNAGLASSLPSLGANLPSAAAAAGQNALFATQTTPVDAFGRPVSTEAAGVPTLTPEPGALPPVDSTFRPDYTFSNQSLGGQYNVAAEGAPRQLGLKVPEDPNAIRAYIAPQAASAPTGATGAPSEDILGRIWGGVKKTVQNLPEGIGQALPRVGSQFLAGALTPEPEMDPELRAMMEQAAVANQQQMELARRGNEAALSAQEQFNTLAGQYSDEDWMRQRAAEEQAGALARREAQRKEYARQLSAYGKTPAEIDQILAPFDTETSLVGQNTYRQTYHGLRDTGIGYVGQAAGLKWQGDTGSAANLAGTAANINTSLYNQFANERKNTASLLSQPFEEATRITEKRKQDEEDAVRRQMGIANTVTNR